MQKGKKVAILTAIILLVLLISIIYFTSGTERSNGNDLSLTGTVKHEYYYQSMGSIYSSISMDEYVVLITVTNQGKSVTYDTVMIYFDGGDGQGLSASIYILDEKEQPTEFTLGTGQTGELNVRTNGYTIDILQHTKTGRVALHVVFLYKDETIDEFHAVLPSLIMWDDKPAELPFWEESSLDFSRDYDTVMEQVKS